MVSNEKEFVLDEEKINEIVAESTKLFGTIVEKLRKLDSLYEAFDQNFDLIKIMNTVPLFDICYKMNKEILIPKISGVDTVIPRPIHIEIARARSSKLCLSIDTESIAFIADNEKIEIKKRSDLYDLTLFIFFLYLNKETIQEFISKLEETIQRTESLISNLEKMVKSFVKMLELTFGET